ncbi:hypothetical protein OW763_09850 [Clostridium aestuarii]|uniref:Uncharacterized protein n=1 Tax=Clostridium aestuarii TaxID=338193 RepID=A0ABT4D1X2_9CLOT|nr:hypothetical protein [Clostridium aestuarii]MCY6484642.1 hypothetical protein [Clostridium aestuarii]
MTKCPFLSTFEKKVNCFEGCPFYECSDTDKVCPFKTLSKNRRLFYKYELFKNDNMNLVEDYVQKEYLEYY